MLRRQPFLVNGSLRRRRHVIQINWKLFSKIHIMVPNFPPTKILTIILSWVKFVICHRTNVRAEAPRASNRLIKEWKKRTFPAHNCLSSLGSTIRMLLMCLYWSENLLLGFSSSGRKHNFFSLSLFTRSGFIFSAPGRERDFPQPKN